MTQTVVKALSLVAIIALSACGGSGSNRADLVFKQVECANQAGIEGSFTTQYVLQNGKQTEVFVAGNGVSEAQAAKANACMGA
ncbi:hypothetical protein RA27_14400 [Ruegeria sp. ANG-R]|uniref:hypothetical protein n=1 Tax=Ruegeria sp. ANG-R TaxID=1577903 RepID=UPI00057C6EDE|nr:hypothetical protein [Ruegeria sp. ANG-R]KIC40033.1 hypothetical protein RA27_14400 [Ruegeria sp. ANG-R]